jgi:uncharacterized protein (DUF2249 family)
MEKHHQKPLGGTTMDQFAATVNATEYPPQLKHKVIFETYDSLKPQEAMLLINDHDPRPLRYQFESMHTGAYTWEYLEQGPDTFRVRIGKL